ncbi:alpha/beta hydrolase family protein [Streptomyces sp. NPDC060194]|uniref:alpha/beta hydrolase family protein n=1 Tax=Streptomyces sp. NPDC060194 TaxID=3347069 RepID=UPI0036533D3A
MSTTSQCMLAHSADGDVCTWKDKADAFAEAGYRVLAIQSNGADPEEITAATAVLRDKGVRSVALMGASKGGTGALVAAADIEPAVHAVVPLSAPRAYSGMNAESAVPRLTVPLLYVAAELDGKFPADAEALHALTARAPEKKLEIVAGSQHGEPVLDVAANWKLVLDFLDAHPAS